LGVSGVKLSDETSVVLAILFSDDSRRHHLEPLLALSLGAVMPPTFQKDHEFVDSNSFCRFTVGNDVGRYHGPIAFSRQF
jgi:hypothetical protein